VTMSILRIGGIASGLDTEQIVKDLMRVERMKTDKLFRQRQVMDWQKEQFRTIINHVRRFRDKYFNIAQPGTNLMSPSTLKKMTASSSSPDVTVTAGADALNGDSTFQVLQSAVAAQAVASAVCANSAAGNRLSLSDNMQTVSSKLTQELQFDENGSFNLSINGAQITIHQTDTLNTVLNRINTSAADVKVSYSTFSDSVTFTAKNTGAGHITTNDGGNFFSALGLVPIDENIGDPGRNAEFKINGFAGTRTSNVFTIDGITYNIFARIDEPTEVMTVTASSDTEGIYKLIEKFIDDYNSLLETINSKLKEERFRDFSPLTEEQKDTMKDKDIDKWEEKAQSGLLKNDSSLENMLRNMRSALYDTVVGFHLSQIGIETSRDYRDQGKLVLKDSGNTLRQAIAANPDKITAIFSQRSEISYSPNLTSAQRQQRYNESGLAHRLSDIISDNIRTTRSNQGHKGLLLEKAGIEGDLSEVNNFIDKRISEINQRMNRMNELLDRKEQQYYRQFTAMEKVLQQLYSQSDWLTMQLNQGFSGR